MRVINFEDLFMDRHQLTDRTKEKHLISQTIEDAPKGFVELKSKVRWDTIKH